MQKEKREPARVLDLNELPLEVVTAHGGDREVFFCRVVQPGDLRGPWNHVDYAVLPPGASIGRHTHGADEELYLILEGQGLLHLDGQDHPVGPGSLAFNRPGGRHGLLNDGSEPLKLFVIEVRT